MSDPSDSLLSASPARFSALAKRAASSLEEATALLRGSAAARDLLGPEFVEHYARTREWEVRQWGRAVTSWELERYFEII